MHLLQPRSIVDGYGRKGSFHRLPRLAGLTFSSRPCLRRVYYTRTLLLERDKRGKMASAENGVGAASGLASADARDMTAPSGGGAGGAASPSAALKGAPAQTGADAAPHGMMPPNFHMGGGNGGGTSESPDPTKTGGDSGARPWPATLPPLPPHLMGADLPIANISRIMKRALPENGKIAKNAKECMQECVSELISFVTSEASDRCGSEKRKTINGDDILYSMRVLGFDNYEQVLKVYLSRYRQAQEENPRQRRRRAMKRRSSPTSMPGSMAEGDLSAMDGGVDDDAAVDDDEEEALSDDAGEDE